jgi:hypothetical protein
VSGCDRFIARLYDADARAALEAGEAAPRDMHAHAQECAACRQAWAGARSDIELLRDSWLEPASADLSLRAARAMRALLQVQGAPLIDWAPAATWAVTAAALAAAAVSVLGPALPWLWQGAIALVAAAAALSAEVTRQGLDVSEI